MSEESLKDEVCSPTHESSDTTSHAHTYSCCCMQPVSGLIFFQRRRLQQRRTVMEGALVHYETQRCQTLQMLDELNAKVVKLVCAHVDECLCVSRLARRIIV